MSSPENRAQKAKRETLTVPQAGDAAQHEQKPEASLRERTEKRRISFREAALRTKLDVRLDKSDRERFQYRWVNGDPGRVQDLRDRGYEIVDDPHIEDDRGAERRVGRTETGSTMKARLMRVPKDFYEEDQAQKREIHEEKVASVSRSGGRDSAAMRDGIVTDTMTVNS